MILSGREILKEMNKGNIAIEPYDCEKINPNSVNLTLNKELMVYKHIMLDMKKDNKCESIIIPEDGYWLKPGELYLGRTNEFTSTKNYVPMLEGRSSVGRLGMAIHITAGFGDVGFEGYWTLEISCIKPIKIYPNIDICQIYYHSIQGEYDNTAYKGKYQNNDSIQPSMMYKDFIKK